MKVFALFAAFVTIAVAAPTLEDQPLQARDTVALAARDEYCNVPSEPDWNIVDTVYQICLTRGLNSRETLAVFETMRVESNYHNLDCGDKDSLGVFQQRPSVQAWGNRDQILNVPHAANAFIDAMLWCSRSNPSSSAGQIAQCAQVSEIPDAYDQAESEARKHLATAISRHSKSYGTPGAVNVGSVPSGASSGGSSGGSCAKSVTAKRGDTCNKIAQRGGISVQTLHSLNGSLNRNCSNLTAGKAYCVKKGSSGGSNNAKPKCKKWYKTKKGDTCKKIQSKGNITFTRLRQLNSNINSSCSNIRVNTDYCIA